MGADLWCQADITILYHQVLRHQGFTLRTGYGTGLLLLALLVNRMVC